MAIEIFENAVKATIQEVNENELTNKFNLFEIYNGKDGGAYRASRYLSKAMSSKGKTPIYSSILDEGIQFEPAPGQKGGMIVFCTDVNAEKQLNLLNTTTTKIDKIAADNGHVGWTIGHYLDGRYTSPKNGKQYGENSLSLEMIGVNFETLVKIAMEICSLFTQESVLIKDYSSGRVLVVDRK